MNSFIKPAMRRRILGASVLCLYISAGAVHAQESSSSEPQQAIATGDELLEGWQYELTVYGWLKSLDGSVGSLDLDLDFADDITDMLDGAFMTRFEVNKGPLVLYANYEYTKISTDVDVELPARLPILGDLSRNITADVVDTQNRFDLGAGYTVHQGESSKWQLLGGAKWFEDEIKVKHFQAFGLGGRPILEGLPTSRTEKVDWWQGFVGGRFISRLSDSWGMQGRLDYGYGGSDSDSWTAEISANWSFNHWGAAHFGYRYTELDHEDGNYSYDMTEQGPLIGLVIHW